jgi:exosortase
VLAALLMAVLFGAWPYQHWYFADRVSLLAGWWRTVGENDEWIFCPLVPLVSAWLAWARRGELRRLPARPDWLGLVLLALGLFAYWVGHRADTAYPGFAAFQIMVAGSILLLAGGRWLRVLFFPWLFLVFMWPAFPLEDQLALPLRLMTANLSAQLLNGIGIDTLREGTGLLSAANEAKGLAQGQLFKLDVEDPCSGIRSLYALMMLAALYGYVFLRGLWPRVTLFLCAIPLAILGNLARMVLLAAGSLWFGMDFAVGRVVEGHMEISLFHELAGYAVFAVALAGMFALSSLLEGRPWKRKAVAGESSPEAEAAPLTGARSLVGPVVAFSVLCVGTLVLCSSITGQPVLSAPGVVMDLPPSLGQAQGLELPMTQRERGGLAADITLSRYQYLAADRSPVLATIVLSGDSRRGLHRPDVCLPGQGWSIMDRQAVPVPLPDDPGHEAMMLRVFRDLTREDGTLVRVRGINLFWYEGYGGVRTADYYTHVFRTYLDSVFKNLNHRWALVSFFIQLPESRPGEHDGLDEAKALEELRDFVGQLAPQILQRSTPSPRPSP